MTDMLEFWHPNVDCPTYTIFSPLRRGPRPVDPFEEPDVRCEACNCKLVRQIDVAEVR